MAAPCVTAAALLIGSCSSGPAPAAPAATAQAAPAAPAPASARPVTDFEWPDPLPACSAEAPALFKGLVIGTWTPEGESGFDRAWIDETGLREAWTKETSNRRTWKGFSVGDPTVAADALLDDRAGPAVGYLFSLVSRTAGGPDIEAAPAVLHVRHRGRLRAFLDGLPLLDLAAPAPGAWGEARAKVVLSGPYSVLLLKLGRGDVGLGSSMDVEVRVSAPDGSPLPGQTWNTMRPGVPPSGG